MPGRGIYSVTVPGAVAGWEALRARFGKLPMSDILAPAIFYAEQGFPVTDVIADAWSGSLAGSRRGAERREDLSRRRPHAQSRRACSRIPISRSRCG